MGGMRSQLPLFHAYSFVADPLTSAVLTLRPLAPEHSFDPAYASRLTSTTVAAAVLHPRSHDWPENTPLALETR